MKSFYVYDLNPLSIQIDATQNLIFSYYESKHAMISDTDTMPIMYQSAANTKTIYNKVANNNCNLYYSFNIMNNKKPILHNDSNQQASTILESYNFDNNDRDYFNLKDIKNNMILKRNNLITSYYLNYLDAENDSNKI